MNGRLVFVDASGHMVSPSVYADGITEIDAAADAIVDASNAALRIRRYTQAVTASGTPGTGTYQSVYDALELIFTTGGVRSRARVLIPAPKAALFLSDGETFDAAGQATLIAAINDNLQDPTGKAFSSFIAGYRRKLPPAR